MRPIATSRGIVFFLCCFWVGLSFFSLLKTYIILSAHISKSQLIPMAAQTQAAGAKTKRRRIITDAK